MAIAKITGSGLASIAVLVVILWGCILAESAIIRTAQVETSQCLRSLRILQRNQAEPASAPAKAPGWKPARPVIG
jgi:hypothetical protein